MWDKDYMLGALRLFQCKLEVAPPFEQAACLDSVGDILAGIEVCTHTFPIFLKALTTEKDGWGPPTVHRLY